MTIVSVSVKIKRDGKVYLGDKCIGRVEQREGTKTGFRFGKCVGQVPTKVWSAYDAKGKRIDEPKDWASGFARGFSTRKDAAEALLAASSGAA